MPHAGKYAEGLEDASIERQLKDIFSDSFSSSCAKENVNTEQREFVKEEGVKLPDMPNLDVFSNTQGGFQL